MKRVQYQKDRVLLRAAVTFLQTQHFTNCFRFINGYLNRGDAKATDNSEYLAFVRQSYLNRLKNNLPKTVLDKTTWLSPSSVVAEVKTHISSITNHFTSPIPNTHKSNSVTSPCTPLFCRHRRCYGSFTPDSWCGSM